jgi:PadR family transcriptional regulator, regulatory protein PadR
MGEFEQLVLLAILHLDNDAYGMEVRTEIERRTGREVSYGAVYTTLDRLEQKGYVAHRMGDAAPVRGGRARKYFSVLPEGRAALRATQEVLRTMWEGVRL